MITIGICEDIKETREMIKQICRKTADSMQLEYEIMEFTNGEVLLSCQKILDILVLDIELPKINGIDIKNHLQEERKETLIIFVTNHGELIQEAFGIHVIGFVNKSKMEMQLIEKSERIVYNQRRNNQRICLCPMIAIGN